MGINFSKVGFTYNPHKKIKKNQYILEDVDLNISEKDEFICVVGHTGSGKSTLIQMMNALLVPTVGSVKVDDNEITYKKQSNLKSVRKKVGLVFQFPEYQLFEETVIKDVAFGPTNFGLDKPVDKAKEALEKLKVDKSFFEKSPFKLSGGEMRKVAISGILASDPEVLILDEPTVGLDPLARKELISLLHEINETKTVIIVTHDMNLVWKVATRVIVLDESKIIYDGNKYNLFKDTEFISKHSLDLPDVVKILKELKEKLNVDINIYQDDLKSAYKELESVIGHE